MEKNRDRAGLVFGVVLTCVGISILLSRLFSFEGPWLLLALSITFLLLYTVTKKYGWLVPGGILAGISSGFYLTELTDRISGGAALFICLGCGFILIYMLDRIRRPTSVWPLIPGGILVGVGVYILGRTQGWFTVDLWEILCKYWPLLLIAAGIRLIFRKKQ